MANALYTSGKNGFLTKLIDMSADTVNAVLVANTYTFNVAHSSYTTDISSHAIGSPVALAGKTVTGDVFDANDVTFPTVTAGSNIKAVVLYHATTSRPIAYIDTGAGLPATGNGGDIQINFSNAASKIFQL